MTVAVPLNKSRIIGTRRPVSRVSVGNPAIADLLVLNPRQLYVVGKTLGTTNVVLWDSEDRVQGLVSLEVTHDLETLKAKLHRLLPGEVIRVHSSQGAIVLSGEVSSPVKMDAAVRLAESFVPAGAGQQDGGVLNLMQVGGAQQVLLEVKVAEMNRQLVKRMNLNVRTLYNGGSIRLGAVGSQGASFPDAEIIDPVLGTGRVPIFGDGHLIGPAVPEFQPGTSGVENYGVFANYLSGNFLFDVVVDAAKNTGLAKILAEPTITAISGQQAKFLAGGEFPVPEAAGLGATSITYKDFGVGLQFVPLVLDSGVISLKVSVSVSELSTENAVISPAGEGVNEAFFVPSLTKRSANSTVELPSGQTIAIAGLLNETLRENANRFPGLSQLPIVGALFRSQEYVKGQTELVIFVTPRLARPFAPELVRLPTDDFVEPTDIEFYLLGRLEGRKRTTPVGSDGLGPDKGGVEDRFGHDL